jgi:hypothetical protein
LLQQPALLHGQQRQLDHILLLLLLVAPLCQLLAVQTAPTDLQLLLWLAPLQALLLLLLRQLLLRQSAQVRCLLLVVKLLQEQQSALSLLLLLLQTPHLAEL